nr:MAG TPA: hypothetical protein [Caudoviricetes sp.]
MLFNFLVNYAIRFRLKNLNLGQAFLKARQSILLTVNTTQNNRQMYYYTCLLFID